jgi:hypothetical protein
MFPVTITAAPTAVTSSLRAEVAVEIELAGAVVRVREGVAPSTLRLVLACLRGSTP